MIGNLDESLIVSSSISNCLVKGLQNRVQEFLFEEEKIVVGVAY